MVKVTEKIKAQKLRKLGHSLKDIAKKLKIAKSSASLWCRNIKISDQQIQKILKSKEELIRQGRLKGAEFQRRKKLKVLEIAEKESKKILNLNRKEFWYAGLALYLAEGSKTMSQVQFTNSDPRIVNFMIRWFKKFYGINTENIKCAILINILHKERSGDVQEFWKKYLSLKDSNFHKIKFVATKQKKRYPNFNNYYGTFNFRIKKSAHLLYKINAFANRLLFLGNR